MNKTYLDGSSDAKADAALGINRLAILRAALGACDYVYGYEDRMRSYGLR